MKKERVLKVKAGGVYYTISFTKDPRDLPPDQNTGFVWGETDMVRHTIVMYDDPDDLDTLAITFYHELVHALANEYHIKRLIDDSGEHIEDAVDLMGVALKEAMASLGINIIAELKARLE